MIYSGILPVTTGLQRIAACNVGQEVAVFGLEFSNTTNAARTVILTLYRQITGSAQAIQVDVKAKSRETWGKTIGLQPGDYLDVSADVAGVGLLWSLDVDTGVNPVATGFTIRGQYSNVASYEACDIVFEAGSSYVAIRNNTAKNPTTEPADWMLLLDGSGGQIIKNEIVAGAPAALNTLDKLAAAIGDNPDFATAIADALALKANAGSLATVAFTGEFNDLKGVKRLAIQRLFFSRELA